MRWEEVDVNGMVIFLGAVAIAIAAVVLSRRRANGHR
jgi:hypothetical protein